MSESRTAEIQEQLKSFSDNIKIITETFKCLDDAMAIMNGGQDRLTAIRIRIGQILAVISEGPVESPYQEIQLTLNTLKEQLVLVENLIQKN